jgi:hypothetical protein
LLVPRRLLGIRRWLVFRVGIRLGSRFALGLGLGLGLGLEQRKRRV